MSKHAPASIARLFALVAALPMLVFSGCGDSSGLSKKEVTSTEHLALREIAEAYRVYTINNKRGPKTLSELSGLEAVGANGINDIRQGKIIVRMEANLPDTSEEPGKVSSKEVLAYEARVPQEGGYVLLLDRNIVTMTPDEFKAATLAGVEAPAEKKGASKTKK